MSPRSHESWKEQLPAYLLEALSPGEKIDLEHHLGGCAECQAELRWLEPAKERLVEEVEQVEPSPALKSRLMAAVAEDLAENPVEEPAVAPARTEATPSPTREKKSKFGWLNFGQLLRPATLGALAVVLFAGVVTGYAVRGGDSEPSGPTVAQRVVPFSSVVGRTDGAMVTDGNSGSVQMENLKKLDEGQVYQAWVQKGKTVEPTDTLFTPRRDGSATASIPNLHDVDAVMISEEPSGGSEQPTTTPIITINLPS